MLKYFAGYAGSAVVMIVIDLVWLGLLARPWYRQGIGHLMAADPNWTAAALFYLLYPVGLLVFAVVPGMAEAGWGRTALLGALFGFFAYATYDLTNLATLRHWPLGLALLDMAWGSGLSAVAATAGRLAAGWVK